MSVKFSTIGEIDYYKNKTARQTLDFWHKKKTKIRRRENLFHNFLNLLFFDVLEGFLILHFHMHIIIIAFVTYLMLIIFDT